MKNISEAVLIHNAVSASVLYSWASVNLAVLLTSSLMNVWDLLALITQPCSQPWTCGHIMLAHLFVIEVLASTFFYTANVANITFPYLGIWNSRFFCQTVSFFCTYLAICSSIRRSICQIAIFRVYMACHRRLSAPVLQKKAQLLLTCLSTCTHVISMLAAALAYMVGENGEISPPYGFCSRNPYSDTNAYYSVQVVKMTTWAFVPTAVTATCYVVAHRLLHQQTESRYNEYQECVQRRHLQSSASAHVDQSQQRALLRMQSISQRIIIMIVLKCVVHYPIAFFYLLRRDEDSKPVTNLIVLSLHYSSTLFNAILYGLADPQMGKYHQKLFDRLCRY